MNEITLATLIDIATKDVPRLAKNIGVNHEPDPGVIFPTVALTVALPTDQGYRTFKTAYHAAEDQLRKWRVENPTVDVFLRVAVLPIDIYEGQLRLQLCKYQNQKHEQKLILQDQGLPEGQSQPNQVQLSGGEHRRSDADVCHRDSVLGSPVRAVHLSGVVKPLVYLAGPITGCSYEGCTDWRNDVSLKLSRYGVEGLSPMRAKDYLRFEKNITGSYEDKVMSCARGITTCDRFDCMRCDVLLVNFLGAKKVSIGTVMEIAWADSQRIPIICVIEDAVVSDDDNVHDHPMIRECIGFRVATLDEAVEVAIKILGTFPQ